ncbi:hypothetical protein [Streptomyces coffeae]|uniref:Integral membrane protein n=1 Tax=Streptomyces coffeae TaxID=621382 RepID=A0ABS1NNC0_9ACTN|nr:hypothetical protein [Streptomyces coffeae]MBL1101584.1 hypothetical protein [Streptomyces coffeae]
MIRLVRTLALWVTRRRDGVGAGDTAFGYVRGHGATMYALVFVCVVETVGMAVLLRPWPVVHWVVLVLDVYTVLWVLELHAACVVRPHVVSPGDGGTSGVLRLRHGRRHDLRIPMELIVSARRASRFGPAPGTDGDETRDGVLTLAVGSQTSLVIELSEPVAATLPRGGSLAVRTVRCHADEPDRLLAALPPSVRAGRCSPAG